MKNASKYRLHRTIGMIVVPLILLSTITGVFRANQKWYWQNGYKKKKQPSSILLKKDVTPLLIISQTIDSLSNKKNEYEKIILKNECAVLYYELTTTTKEKYLVEAQSGRIASPLKKELAEAFAVQYLASAADVKHCELLKEYRPRKSKEKCLCYKIEFNNALHSQLFLDYYTGEIIEDMDDTRKLGMWIVRLHDYDFFESKQTITTVVGAMILLLSFSGLWIYRFKRRAVN
jgi:hypothetical protein